VPHGVDSSSLFPSDIGEYIPSKVDDVRLRIERVLLGVESDFWPASNSLFTASLAGEGGIDESAEAGVISKALRGMGR
jgi:hypothetical protein